MLTSPCLTLIDFEMQPTEMMVYRIAGLLLALIEVPGLLAKYEIGEFRKVIHNTMLELGCQLSLIAG